MSDSLRSLIECGTKLWLDSIDPDLVAENRALGATGATSNPIIIADLIKTGRFDNRIQELVAWAKGMMKSPGRWRTSWSVQPNRSLRMSIEQPKGNDGYVSFELDPLIEDPELDMPHDQRVARYIQLAKQWSAGHTNRMIKVPATPAGLDALEEIVVARIPVNVTLIFTNDQYRRRVTPVGGGPNSWDRRTHSRVFTVFLYQGLTCTRKPEIRHCRPTRRVWWGSSMRSGSGQIMRRSGETRTAPCNRRSFLPVRGPSGLRTSLGSTWPPWPEVTYKQIRPRRTKPWRNPKRFSFDASTNFRGRPYWTKSMNRLISATCTKH